MKALTNWLESHWVTPAYGASLLAVIALCFFGAATNTLSGWLFVMTGVIAALLLIGAVLAPRSLRPLQLARSPIMPVSVGEPLLIELVVDNDSLRSLSLLQIQDVLPYRLGQPVTIALETLPAQGRYYWRYTHTPEKRGIYRWETVQLRTAAPLGLFYCRRSRSASAKAVVYPTVLPLDPCPIIDEIGREEDPRYYSTRLSQLATEGVTRALRPYRWGDPTRLVHWRSSARYGELRVRELEVFTGGQEVIICLDSAANWIEEEFEQAVVAAASLYFYAIRVQSQVCLWTAATGVIRGDRAVLETLAAVHFNEEPAMGLPPDVPLVWLTHNPLSLASLPLGSRYLLWSQQRPPQVQSPGLIIAVEQSLQSQLQSPLRFAE